MTDRMKEVASMVSVIGEEKTSKRLNINIETIHRYMRALREKKSAKILVFDIEIAPNVGYFWHPWQTNIAPVQIIRPWYCLSWSAKWLFDNEIMNDVITPKETKRQKDKRIVKSLWKLFDESDVLIAHHGDKFDIPRMNTKFLLYKLGLPSPYQSVDTKKIASKRFAFNHNKLDSLAEELGIGKKIKTDFDLWKSCDNGDATALANMLEYNDHDTLLLEEVYLKLRPWATSHPNMNNFTDEDVCHACGSTNLKKKGHYTTTVNRYTTYICECGAFTKKIRKNLSGLAR